MQSNQYEYIEGLKYHEYGDNHGDFIILRWKKMKDNIFLSLVKSRSIALVLIVHLCV